MRKIPFILCNNSSKYFVLLVIFVLISSSTFAQERQPILPFSAKDIDGKIVNINDYKGKVIYLDVWATWCLPCRILFPKSQKLEEEFHNKEIVFLYVSVDEDIEKWKRFIFNKKPVGIQLYANEDFLKTFMPNYNIIGIPRFMLIDKQGNVFSIDASRPGWPELTDEINILLAE